MHNDGGPAFARPVSEDRTSGDQVDGNTTVSEQKGMSLRDYMAAKALQGLLAYGGNIWKDYPKGLAVGAYAVADAMLVARSKN